jgi:glycosyltransferase involved in cell wall biosynthesis
MFSVVFASEFFMPEPGATSELLSGIAMALVRRGYNVCAIAGQPTYHGKGRVDRVFQSGGVKVERVWSTQFDKNRPWGRILNSWTFSLSVLLYLLRHSEHLLTVVVTTPPQLPWVYWAAHRLIGVRYLLLIHDVYPNVAVALGVLRKGGWIERLWAKINRLTYENAERIVVLGRDMQRILEDSVNHETRQRLSVIPNWADACAVAPLDRNDHPFLKQLNIADRFVVQYSGNIGRFHEIETILAAAKILENEPAYLFLFIGTGQQVDLVKRAAGRLGRTNIMLLPHQPRDRLGITLTGCDVGLVTLKEGLSGCSVPSKLYGILAAGKPVIVIGPQDCEAALVVRERQCGEVVPPGDGMALAERLRAFRNDPALRERYGKAARAGFEDAYELETISGMWGALLRTVALGR